MASFENLQAWQMAMELLEAVYKLTKRLPKEELFGITSQLRRASVGVVANIAEGYSRSGSNDKAYKYTIARGECAEIHSLLLACIRLGYILGKDSEHAIALSQQTGKLVNGLVRTYSTTQPLPKP